MNRTVTLIGGAGYIGQRLALRLRDRGWHVTIIDPCILCDVPNLGEGIVIQQTTIENFLEQGVRIRDPIVYLAGFHDYPGFYMLPADEKLQWQQAARNLMIDIPVKLAHDSNLIYLSSMRAITHPYTFYGNLKRMAERRLFQHASIVRMGTVWGDLDPKLYNRTITVPNNWAIRGELPDENWGAYISPMKHVLAAIEALFGWPSDEVFDAIQPLRPCLARDLIDWVPALKPVPEELIARETHPALLMADYYDLPLPPEDK